MTRYLAVVLWPVGLVVIFAVATLWSRRAPELVADRAEDKAHRHRTSAAPAWARSVSDGLPSWMADVIRFGIILLAGSLIIYGVMALIGIPVVHHGLTIDRPIYNWTIAHRVHPWASLMNRLTKIGDTWTTWGAAGAAAVCLAVTWRKKRWLPPVVLAAVIFVDHYLTLALRHTFERVGPPDSPMATYPSGGCDRAVVFYGVIAYLLWREFSGSRRTAIWSGAAVAALAFNEGYSRGYLTLHWFTDILSGLIYGSLLLALFIVAVRTVTGPARRAPSEDRKVAAHVPEAAGGVAA